LRNKTPLLTLIIFFLFFSGLPPLPITSANSNNSITIISNQTNVRSGPSLSYQKIGQVHKGDSFTIIKEDGDWIQIRLSNGSKGWVANWLVTFDKQQSSSSANAFNKGTTGVVNADGLRVRSGPGSGYKVVGSFTNGQTVEITDTDGNWIQIHSDLIDGWISKDFVTPSKTTADNGGKVQGQATSAKTDTGTVTADTLLVRSKSAIDGDVIGKVYKGDTFQILEEENNWTKIQYKSEKNGWVASWYLKKTTVSSSISSGSKVQGSTIEILFNGTNIRKQANVQSEVVKRVNKGDVFEVVSLNNDWYQIRLENGGIGYVAGWVVSANGSVAQVTKQGNSFNLKNKTIVIDAGHGGKDVGTLGYRGTLEKDVTLQTAILLSNKLKAAGVNVILTRSNDTFSSLLSRVRTSHYHGADAFISIHYDSISDRSVRGMTSFYYHGFQKALALSLDTAVAQSTNIKNRGTRFGDYHVIRENKQNAVLLELGYLSNPTEEAVVTSREFQEKASTGIFIGLANYFSK
jgi:N-acetylmuramoyl-L-alanine amidase